MIWSLDQDDYTGLFCRQGQFPFTRRVHDILFSSNKYDEQESFSSTKVTKLRTKHKITFVPLQRQNSTSTSSNFNVVNRSVRNSGILHLLLVALLINMTR
jgi:hypothetical protein